MPKVMMKMLCVEPHCSLVVILKQTAAAGVLIMWFSRDKGWLEEMML